MTGHDIRAGRRRHTLRDVVTDSSDWPDGLPAPRTIAPLSGGYICTTARGQLADGLEVVIKRCPYPADIEAEGLRALADVGVPVPAVLGVGQQVLVMEYVDGLPDWAGLGRAVARMHRVTNPRYGWHRDNQAGRLVQHNGWCDDWPSFYAQRRILPHLADPAVPEALRRRLERACDGPLLTLLRHRPPASLTHGDLWAGNVVSGRWLVDPAVSFVDRELEIAYMQMSSSLPAELFDAYCEQWPFEDSYADRRPALQLSKLLVNVRHFGPQHYVPRIEAVLDGYGW
jgi:fructosamine-3-kinase